jgi:hypothetical protein
MSKANIVDTQEVAEIVAPVVSNQESMGAVIVNANKAMTNAEARRKNLIGVYKNEKKVSTYLSPMYRPHFGNIMTVTINGISIRFKVDGSKQEIPSTFADEIERRRIAIDKITKKQEKMSNIKSNVEANPGEIEIF